MQKLLIADSSDIFTSALEAALKEQFQIVICTDGETLVDLLPRYQPDVLILNLMLPYMDGLTALQQSTFLPPLIMAITMHVNAYVERSMIALGIDYVMISPSVNAVVLRLQDLIKQCTAPDPGMDIETKVAHHLHLLNFHTHLDGYRQLCLALPIFAQNPGQFMTKELYPAVAKLCGCTDGRSVERSIRKAIQAAWRCRDNVIWRKYFALNACGTISCPTNKEFICRLAQLLNTPGHLP